MQTGILMAFLAYLAYACSDAAAKALGGSLSVFEIGFFTSLVALVPALFAKRPDESWPSIFRPHRPALVLARMASGTAGGICAVIAFTSLPLAEAYALIFLTPLFVTVLSRMLLGETVGRGRWLALIGGLVGVLLVVRPGFRELSLGHLAGLGAAFCGAFTVILLRKLGPVEKRVTLVGAVLVGAVTVNGVLMIPTFVGPSVEMLPIILFGGLASGIAHLSIVMAARLAPASRIAPTQYSQILWAAVIGALFFAEFPDLLGLVGMSFVGLFGIMALAPDSPADTFRRFRRPVRSRVVLDIGEPAARS